MSEDIHALSGAYAVDALDDVERARFERHLAGCSACQAEVDSLVAAAHQLSALTEVAPPPSLRAKVLAEIATVRPLPPIEAPEPAEDSEQAEDSTADELADRRRSRVRSWVRPGLAPRRGSRHGGGARHRRVHRVAPGQPGSPAGHGRPGARRVGRDTLRGTPRRRSHSHRGPVQLSPPGRPHHLGYGAAARRQGLPAVAPGRDGSHDLRGPDARAVATRSSC